MILVTWNIFKQNVSNVHCQIYIGPCKNHREIDTQSSKKKSVEDDRHEHLLVVQLLRHLSSPKQRGPRKPKLGDTQSIPLEWETVAWSSNSTNKNWKTTKNRTKKKQYDTEQIIGPFGEDILPNNQNGTY